MDIRIIKAPSGGTVPAIPSKSAAHRLLIAAALSGVDLGQRCEGLSEDITATKRCLEALREAQAVKLAEAVDAAAEDGAAEKPCAALEDERAAQLPCGESGSTLRFLLPVAGVLGTDADFLCEGRLPDRPMEPFLKVLADHGCIVEERNPKKLRGRLHGGKFRLPGNVSSQYVTGLLMALPLAEEDSRIIVEGALQSRPYIDLTLQILHRAGIEVREEVLTAETDPSGKEQTVFEVPGSQTYRLPEETLDHIEGDWSNGAFWLVMNELLRRKSAPEGEVICCTGLDADSVQGDKAITDVIRRMREADRAGKSPTLLEIGVADIPDLVPAIAALACGRPEGAFTHIVDAWRLRYKESDRLQAVSETLSLLGADIEEEPEGLLIRSTGRLKGGKVSSFGDHRIVMMAAAAACIADGEILIRGAQAVNKSYPKFFMDYRMLGGRCEEVSK